MRAESGIEPSAPGWLERGLIIETVPFPALNVAAQRGLSDQAAFKDRPSPIVSTTAIAPLRALDGSVCMRYELLPQPGRWGRVGLPLATT